MNDKCKKFNPRKDTFVSDVYICVKQKGHASDYPLYYQGSHNAVMHLWQELYTVARDPNSAGVVWDGEPLAWVELCYVGTTHHDSFNRITF